MGITGNFIFSVLGQQLSVHSRIIVRVPFNEERRSFWMAFAKSLVWRRVLSFPGWIFKCGFPQPFMIECF